jgi:hypothetical protein
MRRLEAAIDDPRLLNGDHSPKKAMGFSTALGWKSKEKEQHPSKIVVVFFFPSTFFFAARDFRLQQDINILE